MGDRRGWECMGDKGVGYKVNWGVGLYEVKKMGEEYGKEYEVGMEVWKEDMGEWKIVGRVMMGGDKMVGEMRDLWMEEVEREEMGEMVGLKVLEEVDYGGVMG